MPDRWAYLKRVVAGAIFGLYMAHLLYFLNPQVDISPGRLAVVTLVYGLICGLLFGTVFWVLRLARVKLFGAKAGRAHGFGFAVLAVFVAAIIYWIHLTVVRDYLPIGAVRILSKATTLLGGTAFVLLLLWVVERTADRRLSRAIVAFGFVLIAVSAFFLYQRRESYRTEKRSAVVANIGTVAGKRPVVFVAIRNLPYDWLVTAIGEGGLPFFEQAAQQSYFARLEPFPTTSPKALWASLATGKLPYRHGVTGRFSYRTPLNSSDPTERFLLLPSGVGFKAWGLIPPVKRISAPLPSGDALPLWTLFERLELRSAVINWPSSSTGGASLVVTDRAIREAPESRPLSAERFNATGKSRAPILAALTGDAMAIDLARQSGYDLRVVALEGFSEAQRELHIFLNELPPRTTTKGAALRAYIQQIDGLLSELARDNPDHLLVICSPSAVVPPDLPATPWAFAVERLVNADPGADDGFLLIRGPGVFSRDNPPVAHVTDVVPTILFASGLPVGRDMDGRIVSEAFDDQFLRRTTLSAIQTYEAEQVIVRRSGA